jgi:hypothetical protein
MTRLIAFGIAALLMGSAAWFTPTEAQPPDEPERNEPKANGSAALVKKMMAFDKNKDGKLTKDEITDRRLLRIFEQADTNKDGIVTKEELIALAAKLEAENGQGDGPRGPGGFGPDGPGGFGGPGGPGRGGPGGPGFGGPPQPGQVLPSFLQDWLKLTAQQKSQIEALQKDVDGRLAKILTSEQKNQLREMRRGFGPPGGPGGFGRPGRGGPQGRGGPPPDRDPPPDQPD